MRPAERQRLLTLAARASVGTSLLLIGAKLLGYLATGSVSLLATLVDSLMDSCASLITLVAVRYAARPPDREHSFGHGKAEPLAALAQATFISGSGLFLLVEAGSRLLRPRVPEAADLGIALMLFSIAVTALLLLLQGQVIRRTDSAVIRADALHYRADFLTNGGVLVALLLAERGWPLADPLIALGIGGWVLASAARIGRTAVDELLDRELPPDQRDGILGCVAGVEGVLGVHDLRTRRSGQTTFIQMHLELQGGLSLAEAHARGERVRQQILRLHPNADVVIHQDPVTPEDAPRDEGR